MGFRSNYITEYYGGVNVPQWFIEKYPNLSFPKHADGKKTFGFAQLIESKFYNKFEEDEQFLDIQKAITEMDLKELVVVLLHECGGITRVVVTHDKVCGFEPVEWKEVDGVEHSYCYRCSPYPKE